MAGILSGFVERFIESDLPVGRRTVSTVSILYQYCINRSKMVKVENLLVWRRWGRRRVQYSTTVSIVSIVSMIKILYDEQFSSRVDE
jgi:hypothetical protein